MPEAVVRTERWVRQVTLVGVLMPHLESDNLLGILSQKERA